MPSQAPRIVALPARYWRDYPPQKGVPDVFGTRVVCLAVALIFLVMLVGLATALALDDSHSAMSRNPLVAILFLLVFALMAACVFLFCRYAVRAGAWFEVDDTGIAYGEGRRGPEKETRIAWADIVRAPVTVYDVGTRYGHSKSVTKDLWFWHRLPTGEIRRHSLPLRLTNNVLACLRYKNQDMLLRAIVLRLAAVKGIRFHAEVFVDGAIDPDTWQPMNKPRRELWISTIVAVGLFSWVIFGLSDVWSPAALVAGGIAFLVICGFVFSWFWRGRYPDLAGIVVFRVDAHQEN
jgi:hypothetical protein